jgi:hypothetical protein
MIYNSFIDVNNRIHRDAWARLDPFAYRLTAQIARYLFHYEPICELMSDQDLLDLAWAWPGFRRMIVNMCALLRAQGECFIIKTRGRVGLGPEGEEVPEFIAEFPRTAFNVEKTTGRITNVRIGTVDIPDADWIHVSEDDFIMEPIFSYLVRGEYADEGVLLGISRGGALAVFRPATLEEYEEWQANNIYLLYASRPALCAPPAGGRDVGMVEIHPLSQSEYKETFDRYARMITVASGYPLSFLKGEDAKEQARAIRRQLQVDFQDYVAPLNDVLEFIFQRRLEGDVRVNISDLFPEVEFDQRGSAQYDESGNDNAAGDNQYGPNEPEPVYGTSFGRPVRARA